jgi:hypothetical protein
MPIEIQIELAQKGCFMEQSYSMASIDGISVVEIASQIKAVGAKSVVLSSDVGQKFSVPPSQALFEFARLLMRQGIPIKDIETMLVTNPVELLTR